MSGIEFRPEDVGLDKVPPRLVGEFLRKASSTGGASSMNEAEITAMAKLIDDFRHHRPMDDPEYEVAVSFISKHGVTVMMAVMSALISGALSAGGIWLGIRDELAAQRNDISSIQRTLKEYQEDRDKYRAKYLPIIESQDKANDRQDANMQALRESVLQLRATVETQSNSISKMHEDLAVFKSMLQHKPFPDN